MKSINYSKPQFEEINLLDETACGLSEPPPPVPRRDGEENPIWKAERRFSKFPWEGGSE